MRETDEEIAEIKREIIESRGLSIRTNNLTTALSADLKLIAKRQQDYEKRINLNSATAYVVFVIVAFGALKLAWDARVAQIKAETENKVQENEKLKKEVKDIQKREEERENAEAKAIQFYTLIREGKKQDAIDSWESVKKEPLSRAELAALEDAVARTRNELSSYLYAQGLERMKNEKWNDAALLLQEAMKLKDASEVSASIKLSLAMTYRKLGKLHDAEFLLIELVNSSTTQAILDEAYYAKAWCEAELQDWITAKQTMAEFLKKFPDSRHYAEGKMYLAQWKLIH